MDEKSLSSKMNIYQRMSAITLELSVVPKDLSVGYGKSSYKAVGERPVLDAVKPLESKYGIYSYPLHTEIVSTDMLTSTTTDYQGNAKESNRFVIRMSVTTRFVNIDKPDEFIDITTFGDGIDSGDKSPGKAMTYACKYALLKAYKISTGDDPDAEASPENGYKKSGNSGKGYQCAGCGTVFYDAQLADSTKRDFGKHLCLACARKTDAERQARNAQNAPR